MAALSALFMNSVDKCGHTCLLQLKNFYQKLKALAQQSTKKMCEKTTKKTKKENTFKTTTDAEILHYLWVTPGQIYYFYSDKAKVKY